jgi:glycerol-3-phosphate dehydrogenase (NAD(P)+)
MVSQRGVKNVAVIGGGRIGQSIRALAERNGAQVRIWDKDASRSHAGISLPDALAHAEIVFFCVPSWALREVMRAAKPILGANTVLVSFAKGLERKTRKLVSDIAKEELPKHPFCVFGGPFMAEEMDHGFLGIGYVGTKSSLAFKKLQSLFQGTPAKLFHFSDVRSVAFAGVLKNAYAVGLGVADGLGWGTNAKGYLASRMTEEMALVAKTLKVNESIVRAVGGSDLIASGFSPYSRNRKTGEEILKWNAASIESESMASFPSLSVLLGPRAKQFPIFFMLSRVLLGKTDPHKAFEKLLP